MSSANIFFLFFLFGLKYTGYGIIISISFSGRGMDKRVLLISVQIKWISYLDSDSYYELAI